MFSIDLLLEAIDNGKPLSDEYLRAEVDTFLFEGHDTTSNAMQHTIFMLARYPEVQAKVHEELDEIFCGDAGTEISCVRTTICTYNG